RRHSTIPVYTHTDCSHATLVCKALGGQQSPTSLHDSPEVRQPVLQIGAPARCTPLSGGRKIVAPSQHSPKSASPLRSLSNAGSLRARHFWQCLLPPVKNGRQTLGSLVEPLLQHSEGSSQIGPVPNCPFRRSSMLTVVTGTQARQVLSLD